MATAPNTTSVCPACDCSESPLSITGDVIGICTFAMAVWISMVYCYRSFRDFSQEMHEMQHRVQLAFEGAQQLRRKFMERQTVAAPPLAPPLALPTLPPRAQAQKDRPRGSVGTAVGGGRPPASYLIDEAWERAEREMIKAARFVNKRLLRPNSFAEVLGSRTAYVVERERAAETVQKLERAMENVKGIVAEVSDQCVHLSDLGSIPILLPEP